MKKIIFSLLAIAATMSAMAVDYTAKVKLQVSADNLGYNSAALPFVLAEQTGVGSGAAEGSATLSDYETPDLALYAIFNSDKYQKLLTEELGELPIGIKACEDTKYTITVVSNSGSKVLKLKDLQEGTIMDLTTSMTPYTFTIADNQKNTFIGDRFQLYVAPAPEADYTRDAATVVGNWYTICVPGGVDATEYASVMDVYTVAGYNAEFGFGVDPMTGAMQPGVPYIFQAKATQIAFNYNEEVAASDPQQGTNYLTGVFDDEFVTTAVAYVVANNKLNWVAEGTAVPANRAYLNYADITDGSFPVANNAPGRKFLPAPKGAVTGLDGAAINGLQNGKFIMNGRFMIVKDGKTTNVLGL